MYLRELRNKSGKTSRDIAQDVGVAHTTILRWERNGRVPDDEKRKKLAKSLGVGVGDIPGGTPRNKYAETESDVTKWLSEVLRSPHSPDEKLVLSALAAFWDSELVAVSISREALIEETSIGENRVNSVWDTIVASEFLERRGRSRWTFKLRFPDPDSETIDA